MAWSNDVTFKFIELYKNEPAIWNPKNPAHKDKTKVTDAWERIADVMEVPVADLKKKKETLMAAFRLNHKKRLASLKSDEEVFKPIWIFYEAIAAFMSDVYDCRIIPTEDGGSTSSFTSFQEKWNPVIEIGVEELSNEENSAHSSKHPLRKQAPSHSDSSAVSDTVFAQALSAMSNAISLGSRMKSSSNDEDECDIYGKLLAKKLKRYGDIERLEIMYEIDGLFLQKRIKLESTRESSPDFNNDGY